MPIKSVKIVATGYLLFFLFFLLLPLGFVSADATLIIGDKCERNDQCLSGDCEESSKMDAAGKSEWYCDCDELGISDSDDCLQRYHAPADGGKWRCINGFDETYGLDYCISTNKENIFFPVPPTNEVSIRSKAINFLLNPTASSKIEVTNIMTDISDKLAIKIPGLDFSKLSSSVDEEGYLYIPWIGQYIAAMYKFGVAMASIVAVIMIIVQGARIIVSGGGEGKTAGYKRIGQVLLGLMILWGSYAIMYTINPALVSFTALRIKYIEPEPMATWTSDNMSILSSAGVSGKKYCGCVQFRTLYATSKLKSGTDIAAKINRLMPPITSTDPKKSRGPSPLANYGDLIAEMANKYQLDPMLVISIWLTDSGLGTAGAGKANKNPGNIICGGPPGKTYTCDKSKYKFRIYQDWESGIRDWFSETDIKTGPRMWRTSKTIRDLISHYAPPSDPLNNTPGYIDNVTRLINSTNDGVSSDVNNGNCPC